MKLLVAITQSEDAGACMSALSEAGFVVTRLQSTGGFLQKSNETLVAGMDEARVDEAIELIRRHCRDRSQPLAPAPLAEAPEVYVPYQVQVEVGGATIFVLDVARFERI
jgi:uncharacterized protein YaaQ